MGGAGNFLGWIRAMPAERYEIRNPKRQIGREESHEKTSAAKAARRGAWLGPKYHAVK